MRQGDQALKAERPLLGGILRADYFTAYWNDKSNSP
jgi:hypothetical protein